MTRRLFASFLLAGLLVSAAWAANPKQVYSRASAAASASGNSGDLSVAALQEIAIDANVSASSGTSPTVTFAWQRKGTDGNYYTLWTSSAVNATTTVSQSIGPGLETTKDLGLVGRLTWTIGGSNTPSETFSVSVTGR